MSLPVALQAELDANLQSAVEAKASGLAMALVRNGARTSESTRKILIEMVGGQKQFAGYMDWNMHETICTGSVREVRNLLDFGADVRPVSGQSCALLKALRVHDDDRQRREMVLFFLAYRHPCGEGICSACTVAGHPSDATLELRGLDTEIPRIPLLSLILAGVADVRADQFDFTCMCGNPRHDEQITANYGYAAHRKTVECAALEIMRPRMTEICIGMQALGLPALVTVLLIEEACWVPGTEFRRAHTWAVAATVKHWRDKHPVQQTGV